MLNLPVKCILGLNTRHQIDFKTGKTHCFIEWTKLKKTTNMQLWIRSNELLNLVDEAKYFSNAPFILFFFFLMLVEIGFNRNQKHWALVIYSLLVVYFFRIFERQCKIYLGSDTVHVLLNNLVPEPSIKFIHSTNFIKHFSQVQLCWFYAMFAPFAVSLTAVISFSVVIIKGIYFKWSVENDNIKQCFQFPNYFKMVIKYVIIFTWKKYMLPSL